MAEAATRWSSSSQSICSSVAPGIIIVVKTRRKVCWGRPHPTLISCANASSCSWLSIEPAAAPA